MFSLRYYSQGNKGMISNIIYGTSNSDDSPENDIAASYQDKSSLSHSKAVSDGVYVHELAFHNVKPGKSAVYTDLLNRHQKTISRDPDNHSIYVGSWKIIVGGDLDQYMHIWKYKGYSGYQKALDYLPSKDYFQAYESEILPLLRSRENQICLEFAFWKSIDRLDFGSNGLFELRSYTLKPGNLLEWESQWRRGLEIRKRYCSPVGAWFNQLGTLSRVHHLWYYPDFSTRKANREAAWEAKGWAETVHNTGRFCD